MAQQEDDIKVGLLLMAQESVMSNLPFVSDDFGMDWEPAKVTLTAESISYTMEEGGDSGSIPLSRIMAVAPEEIDDLSCLSLKVEEPGEDDEKVHRLRCTERADEDDLQQWKMAILMNVEAARDAERARNGHVFQASPVRPSSPSGPNTHPKSEGSSAERRSSGGKLEGLENELAAPILEEAAAAGPTAAETISTKTRTFEETPREGQTETDAMKWAASKEDQAQGEEAALWKAKWEASEERVAVLTKERVDSEAMEAEHGELVSKLESMREEEVSEWRERCKTREAEVERWRDKCIQAEAAAATAQKAAEEGDAARGGEEEALLRRVSELEGRLEEARQAAEETDGEHASMVAKLQAMQEEENASLHQQIAQLKISLEAQASVASTTVNPEDSPEWEAKTAALLEKQKTALKSVMDTKLEECDAKTKALEAEKADLASQLATATAQVEKAEAQLAEQREDKEATEEADKAVQLQLEAAAAKEKSLQKKIEELQAEVKELQDLLLEDDDD